MGRAPLPELQRRSLPFIVWPRSERYNEKNNELYRYKTGGEGMEKYMSLLTRIEEMMQSTSYQEGDRLPSIRQLSARYQVSKSTVIRALQELEKRHLIYSVPKSGYYIVKKSGNQKAGSLAPSTLPHLRRIPMCFRILIFSTASTKRLIHTKRFVYLWDAKGFHHSSAYSESSWPLNRYLRMNGIFSLHQVSSRRYPCFVPCRSQMGRRSPLNSRATI